MLSTCWIPSPWYRTHMYCIIVYICGGFQSMGLPPDIIHVFHGIFHEINNPPFFCWDPAMCFSWHFPWNKPSSYGVPPIDGNLHAEIPLWSPSPRCSRAMLDPTTFTTPMVKASGHGGSASSPQKKNDKQREMGVSRNGGNYSKWMVYNGKSQAKMDDLGVPLF